MFPPYYIPMGGNLSLGSAPPGQCTVFAFTRHTDGTSYPFASVNFSMMAQAPGNTDMLLGAPILATSNASGLLQTTLIQGATYSVAGVSFVVPMASTFQLPPITVN